MPAGTIQNSIFNEAYDPAFDGTLSQLVFFEGTGSGKPSYSINNVFNFGSTMTAVTLATMNTPIAATAHVGSGGTLGTVNYLNNNINGLNGFGLGGIGAGVGGATVNVTGGTWLEAISPLAGPGAGRTTNVTGVRFKSLLISSNYFANTNGGGTLNISSTTICISNINQYIFRKTDASATTLNVTGNTIYGTTTQIGASGGIVDFGTNLVVTSNNNIFDFTNMGGSFFYGLGATNPYTGNNNAFIGTDRFIINGVTYNTLALMQAGTGQDAASVTTGSGASACN